MVMNNIYICWVLTKLLLIILTGEKLSQNSKKEKAVKVVEEIFVTTAMLLVDNYRGKMEANLLAGHVIGLRDQRICFPNLWTTKNTGRKK